MNKKKVLSLVLSALLLMPGAVYAKENKDVHGKPAMEQKASEVIKATTNEQVQKQGMHIEDTAKTEKLEAPAASSEKGKGEEHKQAAQQNRDEKRAQIEAFKTAMKSRHEEMKKLRQETIALRQTIEQKTEKLAGIISDLQSGKKTLSEDMLNSLLAAAQNLKVDEEQIKETAEISTEAKDTQARVKGADFNNALASMDKVIAKYQKRLAALKQLDVDLDEALKIAEQAVVPVPADTATTTTPTSTTTTTQDQTQSESTTSTQTNTASSTTPDSTSTQNSTTTSSDQTSPADTSTTTTSTP